MRKQLTEAQTETAAVAALVEDGAARPAVIDIAGVPVLVLPQGYSKTEYDSNRPRPLRSKGILALATVDSLARYVGKLDTGATQIFTYRQRFEVAAIFNPATKENPGWADDGAKVVFVLDHCLKQWHTLAGKWLTQTQFGEFLRERGVDIMHPDSGSVLDLVENLETHSTVKGKFARRAQDGSFTIQWEEDVQAQTRVPEKFTLRLPCFLLSETMFEVECRLNFRAKDGQLHWQFLIDEFEVAMDAAWDAELAKLRSHAALPKAVREQIFAAA